MMFRDIVDNVVILAASRKKHVDCIYVKLAIEILREFRINSEEAITL